MAHVKSGGSAKRTVDVAGKRLGVKKFGGEAVKPGDIIIRQRGTKTHPGLNVGMGKDHTIFAKQIGFVSFRMLTGHKRGRKIVDVVPEVKAVKVVSPKSNSPKASKVKASTTKTNKEEVKAVASTSKTSKPKATKVTK